jgi:hypothetical protein
MCTTIFAAGQDLLALLSMTTQSTANTGAPLCTACKFISFQPDGLTRSHLTRVESPKKGGMITPYECHPISENALRKPRGTFVGDTIFILPYIEPRTGDLLILWGRSLEVIRNAIRGDRALPVDKQCQLDHQIIGIPLNELVNVKVDFLPNKRFVTVYPLLKTDD